MSKMNFIIGDTIDGHKISQYGMEHGFVDYGTLAECFDHVLANNILSKADDWEIVNGDFEDEDGNFSDVFQVYIISEYGADILSHMTDEIIEYSNELDMYVWCVTHWGTAWNYVLTNIKANVGYEYYEKWSEANPI